MDEPGPQGVRRARRELISLRLQQRLQRRQIPPGTGPGFLIFFPPPNPGKTSPTWWDLYPQYLNPFYTPTPSVDWWDTGLKVGKGTAAVTAGVCLVASGGLAVGGGTGIKLGGPGLIGLLKGAGEITLRKGGRIFCRINPRGTWKPGPGRFPHYHRRPIGGGKTPGPGEGINRHRPWEPPAPGEGWWKRF